MASEARGEERRWGEPWAPGGREQRPDHVEINPQGAGSWSSSGLREDASLEPGTTEETVGRRPDWQVGAQGTQELVAELPQGDCVTLPMGQLQLWKSFLPCENAASASPGSWKAGLPSAISLMNLPQTLVKK